jgi:hypothetical protein
MYKKMDITPIIIDIFNIRQERQKYNNNIALKRLQDCNLTKDINIISCKILSVFIKSKKNNYSKYFLIRFLNFFLLYKSINIFLVFCF